MKPGKFASMAMDKLRHFAATPRKGLPARAKFHGAARRLARAGGVAQRSAAASRSARA